jgi:hypothetical protein
MTRRFLAGGLAAVATLLLTASATLAGGWATIEPDAGAGPPTEDEATDLGFTVLQHGMTPAGWEQPTVVLEEVSTGQTFDVPATASGADGHFVASFTLPAAGFWTWHVELRDLVVETPPSILGVLTIDGVAPTFDAASITALVDRSSQELRNELGNSYGSQIETLSGQVSGLSSQLARVSSERDELAAQVEAIQPGTSSVPVVGLLALSILGGAVAGFVMASLARRTHEPAATTVDGPVSTTPLVVR